MPGFFLMISQVRIFLHVSKNFIGKQKMENVTFLFSLLQYAMYTYTSKYVRLKTWNTFYKNAYKIHFFEITICKDISGIQSNNLHYIVNVYIYMPDMTFRKYQFNRQFNHNGKFCTVSSLVWVEARNLKSLLAQAQIIQSTHTHKVCQVVYPVYPLFYVFTTEGRVLHEMLS